MGLCELNENLSIDMQKARWRKGLTLSQAARYLNLKINEIKAIEDAPISCPLRDLYKVVMLYEVPQESLWPLQTLPINFNFKK
jgi:hypothetical protein